MRYGTATRERHPEPLVEEQAPSSVEQPQCVHHWVIDSPAGSTSMGFCRVCGERKAFANYVSDFIFEGDSTETLSQGGWKKPVTELVKPDGEGASEAAPGTEGDY